MDDKKSVYQIMVSSIRKDFIPTDEQINKINSFMFCRTIANNPIGAIAGDYINRNYNNFPIKSQYYFVRSALYNVNYISFKGNNINKIDNIIELISKHYNCSIQVAYEYKDILSPEQLEKLQNLYNNNN